MRLHSFSRDDGDEHGAWELRQRAQGDGDLSTSSNSASVTPAPKPSTASHTIRYSVAPDGITHYFEVGTSNSFAVEATDITYPSTTTSFPTPTPGRASATYSADISTYADGPIESGSWEQFSQGVKAGIVIAGICGIVAIVIASIWFCCGKPRRRRLRAEEDMERYRERLEAERAGGGVPGVQVPLRTLSRENAARDRTSIAPVAARGAVGRVAERLSRHVSLRSTGTAGGHGLDVPPPQYEEHVPPAHQRLAGGMARRGDQMQIQPMVEEDDGMGVVADGKTPLSEIPFEDVVLTPTNGSQASGSASPSPSGSEGGRDFGERHAMGNGGGNTYGHTNA